MIPPALSEMRKDMLPGELLELIEDMPEMKNWEISDNKGWKEPVTPMHNIVMIKVIPNISECKLTVIVISMMTFCQVLVEGVIKVAQNPSTILWSMIE